jgi:hypothetical protein
LLINLNVPIEYNLYIIIDIVSINEYTLSYILLIYIVTTDPLNRDDFDVMNVYLSHLMMAHEGRNM